MINYMKRIAIKANSKRRQLLVDILKDMNCPFTIQGEKIKNYPAILETMHNDPRDSIDVI